MADVKDIETIQEEIRRFYESIRDRYSVKKIILYGSYAKGTADENSDIDIGVILDNIKKSEKIDASGYLFRRAAEVDTAIEPLCILWSEYLDHEPASILAEIIRTGIDVIHE